MRRFLGSWSILGFGLVAVVGCGDDGGGMGGAGSGGKDTGTGGQGGAEGECIITAEHPIPRGESMGVVDRARNRIVFFGGDKGVPENCNPSPEPIGETWTYDIRCKVFEQVPDQAGGPSPRARGVAVYDSVGDRMIMFGGRYRDAPMMPYDLFNDVWALDLAQLTWQQIQTTGTAPSPRSSTAAVFDAATNELVIFGGNESSSGLNFTPKNDVWALDLGSGAWRQVQTTGGGPEPREFHAAAIDPARRVLYVHAGGDANAFTGPFLSDLWSLDLATGVWTEEDPGGAGAPDARINGGLFFDAATSRVILFAGHDDGAVGNQNDTWAFDTTSKTWSAIVQPEIVMTQPPNFCVFPPDFTQPNLNAPDRRSGYLGVQDPDGPRFYVYGGKTDCGNIDDVWSFDFATGVWTEESPSTIGEACLRGDHPEQCSTLCI